MMAELLSERIDLKKRAQSDFCSCAHLQLEILWLDYFVTFTVLFTIALLMLLSYAAAASGHRYACLTVCYFCFVEPSADIDDRHVLGLVEVTRIPRKL